MAQPNPQLRINQLAKDLSVKSKDILDIFEAAGLEGKTHMATLTPDEFGLLIWTLTENRQVSNIDDYLDGIIKIKTKAQNAADKAAKDAEEKAKREQEEKAAEARRKEEEEKARKEAQKAERDKHRPENRTATDRFEQRRSAPQQQPKPQQAQPQQKAQQPQQQNAWGTSAQAPQQQGGWGQPTPHQQAKANAAEARKRKNRLEKLQKQAEKLEAEIEAIDEELCGSAATDYKRAAELDTRKSECEEELMAVYEELEELEG